MANDLTSPLTLQALLASGGGAPQDPAIAAALPRLNMAQAMMQQGTSDAPTNKFGALNRVAQALLGTYTFNQANEGIQDILKQRQTNQAGALQSFFGTPGPNTGMPPAPTPVAAPTGAPSIQGFADQLAPAEAPNAQKVNDQGFAGQFQYGAGRLASIGLYHPAAGENLKANEWKGTFNIPGFPAVKTLQDYLASPAAQHAGLMLDVANTDHVISQTPGAENFDHNGIRAVAHLGGMGGMQKFVESGGKYNPADSNGTHLSDYYTRFSSNMPSASGQQPTGQQAPQTSQSLDMMRKAMGYAVANPYDPAAQRTASMMMDYAKTLGTLDTFRTNANGTQTNLRTGQESSAATPRPHFTVGPNGVQTEANTGKQESAAQPLPNYAPDPNNPGVYQSPGQKPVFAPTPRPFIDAHGNVGAVLPGGGTAPLASNPSGFTGQTPESNAMRTMAEIGPKIISGTASTQERANYETAATTYQQFKTVTLPADQSLGRVATNPLPSGMPEAQNELQSLAPGPIFTESAPGTFTAPGREPKFAPSPRPFQTAAGEVGAVGPGGGLTTLSPANNPGVAARQSAAAQGTETGRTAATIPNKMFDLGRESDQAINNIDYGMNQLHQAAAGGIPSGYFAPWLATASAAGKSLGIDTKALGVDPNAVGNVQSAQKTLGVVAGTILQNAIGKDSAITDAKIEHFIHTQPGIETDPEAIQRVLNWARSQFVYNREMAMDAMHNMDPNTGMLPPGWRASFVTKKGAFAPIYDPLSGESTQPAGQGPSATPPATPAAQSQAQTQPTYREGQTASGPGGAKVIFQGGKWVPVK